MRAKLLSLCGIVLAVAMGCQSTWQDDFMKSGRSARDSHSKPDVEQADPEPEPKILPETYLAAGRLSESRGEVGLAITMYRKVIALNHECTEAHSSLGLLLEKLGDYRQAEQALRTAVELAPDKAFHRNNLAFVYIRQKQWERAESELRRALELQPDFARARANLGMVLANTSRYQEAVQEFSKILPPESVQYNMGLLCEANQQHDRARECYAQALALNPRMTVAQESLKRLAMISRPGEASPPPPAEDVGRPHTSVVVEPLVEAEPATAVLVEPKVVNEPPHEPPANTASLSTIPVERIEPLPVRPGASQGEEPAGSPAESTPTVGPTSHAQPLKAADILAIESKPAPRTTGSQAHAMAAADARVRSFRELTDLIYEARVWWAGEGGERVRRYLDGLSVPIGSHSPSARSSDPRPPLVRPEQIGGDSIVANSR